MKNQNKKVGALCRKIVLCGLMGYSSAYSGVVTFNYSFFDTPSWFGFAPIPLITGQVKYEAASLFDPIERIQSINMTVGTHAYTLPELGFFAPSVVDPVTYIFGKEYQDSSLLGTDDFYISFIGGSALVSYGFSMINTRDYWKNFSYLNQNSFSFTFEDMAQAIPEPSSLALVGAGAIGFAASRTRRRNTDGASIAKS